MIGFIKSLLGSKQQAEPAPTQQPETPVVSQKPAAFFLDADEAQTFGNLEYMRTAKAVKRSFPKTVNNEEIKTILEISAMKRAELAKQQALGDTSLLAQTVESAIRKADPGEERRRGDTSMDLFRNMAKDLKKS